MHFFKKFKILLSVTVVFLTITSNAKSTEECFEGLSRAVFKFNMAVDDIVLEPVAKGYNNAYLLIEVNDIGTSCYLYS